MLAARTWSGAILCLTLLLPSAAPAGGPDGLAGLSGSVRDDLGNLLAGVELLFVLAASDTPTPAARALTDDRGRFVVDGMLPGRYRVAALKRGYRTSVGQVDTLVQRTLDLVLRPTAGVAPQSVPADAAWSLRLPRRGILRDVDPRPASETGPAPPARLADELSLQIEQLFAVGTASADPDAESAEVRPSETRMELASTLGERGQIAVRGRRERIGTPRSEEDTTAVERGSEVSLDLTYDTGSDGQLDVGLFVHRSDWELSNPSPGAPSTLQQERKTWGYDASWTRPIDSLSRVAVEVDYRDVSLLQPRTDVLAPADPLSSRAMAAQGTYQRRSGADHAVQVGLGARVLQFPGAWLPASAFEAEPLDAAPSRWSLHADAQDTWTVSAPFSLVYGVGFRQALAAEEANLLVPRVGGALSSAGWFLRATMSYHDVIGGDGEAAGPGSSRLERAWGYEAELEVDLARDVRLAGSLRYSPVQLDPMDPVSRSLAGFDHPLYLTDGNTAVQEQRVALVEDRGPSSTYFEIARGVADGTVAPLLPFSNPFRIDSEARLGYHTGRFGVRIPHHGTDLQLEYLRVEARSASELDERQDSAQESVELRVRQDLPAAQIPGVWRVLLALRLGSVESKDLEEWDGYGGRDSVQALKQRFSAGVSVVF